jgi:low affinity Fe/Cu permease
MPKNGKTQKNGKNGKNGSSANSAKEVQPVHEKFRTFAYRVSAVVGTAWAFLAAVLLVVVWALTGPIFHFSETWQLVINTGTTIVTFLMVFLIQNTQNRDMKAIHLKLDELIRGGKGPRNRFVDLEDLSDKELDQLMDEFQKFQKREKARASKS